MRLKLIVLLVFCGLNLSMFSQNDSIFSKANEAYADANYQEAKRLYLNIIKNGEVSGELYYNLGNTFYKLENIPQSIYYYEKALKLNPEDEDIKNNLSFAERMRLDQFQQAPESEVDKGIENLVTLISVDSWSYLGIVLLITAAVFFAAFLFYRKPSLKRFSLGVCFLFIILSIGAFTLAQTQLNNIKNSVYAIIFEKEKKLLEEPNPKSSILFDLHEGTKIKILDQFRSYYQVELPDGTTGWLTTENVKEI
jgi:tetratricopeptide (TPR) repeat protein